MRCEGWRDRELDRETAPGQWFIAALALAGALVAGVFLWVTRSPGWSAITAFGLGWVVGALAIVRLQRIFAGARVRRAASGTSPSGGAAPPVSRTG
ncbi:hypothetical protein Amsp01_065690 [Amycolatopsis sp. NBRC 101858]|nr:hypothetical protein Amsp01_065690 [Amycolatopsis sp. NBRC 101858]